MSFQLGSSHSAEGGAADDDPTFSAPLVASGRASQQPGPRLRFVVDGTQSWPFGIALTCLVLDLLLFPLLAVLLWKRRDKFPLSSTPLFLQMFTLVGAALYIPSLLQSLVFPSIPCWLSILLSWAELYPFFCGTMVTLLRSWFVYNFQQSRKRSEDSWFTRHAAFVSDAFLARFLVGLACLTALLPIFQLGSRSPASLSAAMIDPACRQYAKGEWELSATLLLSLVLGNMVAAFLMRNVEDAFNLRESWKSIIYFFVLGTPLASMANGGTSRKNQEEALLNAYAFGQFAFVAASFAYMWYGVSNPTLHSYSFEKEQQVEGKGSSGGVAAGGAGAGTDSEGGRERETSNEDDDGGGLALCRALHAADLKRILGANSEIFQLFKDYSAKEFMCENVLFLEAIRKLRDEVTDKPENGPGGLARRTIELLLSDYLARGAACEINIEEKLRNRFITLLQGLLSSHEGHLSLDAPMLEALQAVEEQVYRMLLDPYNRFVKLYRFGRLRLLQTRDGTFPPPPGRSVLVSSSKAAGNMTNSSKIAPS